jgi:maleylpyruvate isomerase
MRKSRGMTTASPIDGFDPTEMLTELADATGHLIADAEELDDASLHEPTSLPGWTRAHVLTHMARNADGLCNLLEWAVTGQRHDVYPSVEAREAAIEEGAKRDQAAIVADLRESADRFAQAAAGLTPEQWTHPVERRIGGLQPAGRVPWWRLDEVLVHHVDLDTGYTVAHWPAMYTGPALRSAAARFSDPTFVPSCPAFRLYAEDTDLQVGVCCDPQDETATQISGPEPALLGWLIGRTSGDGLDVRPHGPLPALPAWM